MSKKLIHAFPRNDREEVCVSAGEYRDKMYVDLRVFFRDGETDELRPTKKGLTIALDFLPELRKALEKAALELAPKENGVDGTA
jgi:hypothetical protein